jgi:hypothetical protein
MAKPKLMGLSIRRKPGGGHTVTHEYDKAPSFTPGKNGGMGMDQPAPETHNFGAGEHKGLLDHIAAALALKGMSKGMPGSQAQAAGAGMQQGGLPEG